MESLHLELSESQHPQNKKLTLPSTDHPKTSPSPTQPYSSESATRHEPDKPITTHLQQLEHIRIDWINRKRRFVCERVYTKTQQSS